MEKRTVVIGNDHAGTELKYKIMKKFEDRFNFIDCGTDSMGSVDYPDFAGKVCKHVTSGEANFGVLICGSGVGMSIAANRYVGIRAVLCYCCQIARLARSHNDANIICFGARLSRKRVVFDCIAAFDEAEFDGGRHLRRIQKIENISDES